LDSKAAPRLEIASVAGQRHIRLSGAWVLYALLDTRNPTLKQLRALHPVGSEIWDLTGIERLDSGAALVLWRTWGGRRPEQAPGLERHAGWFQRLEQIHLERPPPPGRFALMRRLLPALGERVVGFWRQLSGILLMIGQFFVDLWHCVENPRLFPLRELSATIFHAGAQSVFLLAFLGILIGLVLTWEISGNLVQFGLNQQVINAVGLAFTRELGPFIAALVLVGRIGSATTAGIGAMRITEEVDALRAFGVSPTLRVVMPKVLGMTLAMPLMVVWTDFWGILGGVYLSETQLGVTWQMWLKWFPGAVPVDDFFIGIVKGAVFGFLIGISSAYYGLTAPPDTQGLTRNITRSVVVGLSLILVIESAAGFMTSGVAL
jgi:phospholipid/cholesterol/gamma-HCH transport system permease protein